MRLINADALEEEVNSWGCNDYDKYDFLEVIDNAPTVTIKEWVDEMPLYIKDAMLEALAKETSKRPHGKWIEEDDDNFFVRKCSNCNEVAEWLDGGSQFLSNYCPNCGAQMEKEGDE